MKNKRRTIRFISYTTSLVVALGAFGLAENHKRREYEQQITASQQSALRSLSEYLDDIELSLTKGRYASTPTMVSSLASSLWRDATGAKTSLSHLNSGESTLTNVYKFLSQVGEFTLSLSRKVSDGEEISEDERNQLDQLLSYATQLCAQLDYLEMLVQSGELSFEQIESTLSIGNADDAAVNFASLMNDAEQSLTDYPTLLYDGPFADNIDQLESELVKTNGEIDENKAAEYAAQYAGISIDEISLLGEGGGKVPAYSFSSGGKTISVTKNGGFLIYMLSDAYAGEEVIPHEEAVEKALAYLDKNGYKDMKESYYSTSDGIITINFAYTYEDIIYYPDLIKVSLALDTGEITSVDARGYIMNHHDRELDAPAFTIETGREIINKNLTIKSSRSCVIPKDNGEERYAYEYHCADVGGQEVLIYIDSKTGNEAEIMLLMYADGGILTR